jgi:hypothetical protein
MNKKFNEWVSEKYKLWFGDKKKWKNRVANFKLSPKELEYYWQNKDDNKEPISPESPGEVSPSIKNSPANRPPNWRHKVTKAEKYLYLLANICYIRDYNVLPISMISQVGKYFKTLLAKDRGTFNFYLSKKDVKCSISHWKRVLNLIDKQDYKSDERLVKVINRIKHLVGKKSAFSLREAIPNDIWEDWYNDEEAIIVRMKFESFKAHKGEMTRLNNTTNPWVVHNHIMADKILPLVVENDNTYSETILDDIYNEACKYDLFMGQGFVSVPHQKIEEFEGFLPWLYTSLNYKYKDDLSSIVNILSRDSESNTKLKKIAYEESFKSYCVTNPSKPKFEDNQFYTNIKYLNRVGEHDGLSNFKNALSTLMTSHNKLKNRTKKQMPANITDLRPNKWDTFMVNAFCIKHALNVVYKGVSVSRERTLGMISEFYKQAEIMLQDDTIIDNLISENGGLANRYEYFWKLVTDKTIDVKKSQMSGKFDFEVLEHILISDFQKAGLFMNKDTEIYDVASSTEVQIFKPMDNEMDRLGEKGHLIPTDELHYGNCVVQSPENNEYNDNHPIEDIDDYIENYMKVVNEVVDNPNPLIILNTKAYLNSWKNQKDYNPGE